VGVDTASATYIVSDRDYCVSAVTMPATCNGVETSYTPYTCPHPLTEALGSCDSALAGGSGYNSVNTLEEITPVTTPASDSTPSYTFSSLLSGTITYGGPCSSVTTSATAGNNEITFNALSAGTYNNCTIKVGNSNTLAITPFTIVGPTCTLTEPAAGGSHEGTVTMTATCTVADSTCAGVTFTFSGAGIAVEDTSSPYTIDYDTTVKPNAGYTLYAVCRSTLGATSNSDSVGFVISNPYGFGPHKVLGKLMNLRTISAGGVASDVTWQGAATTWQGGAVTW
jgi:hypothetical protein